MSEWHVTPEYVLNNWTEAQLVLWCTKRDERINEINQEIEEFALPQNERPRKPKRVSAEQLFATLGQWKQ